MKAKVEIKFLGMTSFYSATITYEDEFGEWVVDVPIQLSGKKAVRRAVNAFLKKMELEEVKDG